jgi:hypothetical protein
MVNRLLLAIAVCGSFASAAPASAADIVAQLFPLTGEVRLLNREATPLPFVFYSISSASGALNGSSAVWKSITEHYDSPLGLSAGNGLIDSNGDWVKLSSDSTSLTEGALDADGGSLPALRAVSLGSIWDSHLSAFPDLMFDIQDDAQSFPVTVELAIDGDCSGDGAVDAADYVVWRKLLGSTSAYFADGELDGVIDTSDYAIWRENFGETLPLPPYGAGGGASSSGAVPEPTNSVLFVIATAMSFCGRRAPALAMSRCLRRLYSGI